VYAAAQADLKRIEAQAYADGIVTAEEQRAITDATSKAEAARVAAINAAALDATAKADAARNAAEAYAAAQADLKRIEAQAYADGIVTAEEQRAIADATSKAEAARVAAINAAALDATAKADAARTGAVLDVTPAISAKLNKAGDTISGRISFTVSDGMFAGSDTNNGVYFGKDGIIGRKAGSNTFYINTAGDAVFQGDITSSRFMTGAYTGYAWPPAGQCGSFLGPEGLLLGNANNGKYFQVTYDGNMYAPGMKVENGTLTISQINVINTLQIGPNQVTLPLSAYTESSFIGTKDNWGRNYGTVQQCSITSTGAKIIINMSCEFTGAKVVTNPVNGTESYVTPIFRMYRTTSTGSDAVILVTKEMLNTRGTCTMSIEDTPGVGSFIYYLQIQQIKQYDPNITPYTGGTASATNRFIGLLEAKR
jgi:hypothetical protein